MERKSVVTMENVKFSYNRAPVLDNVNLAIKELEFVWVVGPNGGGKSTLLKLILGLLHPTSGTVRVLGESPEAARSRIGYMPQQVSIDPQFPVTALDIVLMGRLGRHAGRLFYRARDRDAAKRALKLVGLDQHERRTYAELSGGQQRRLFIARALACEPDILLLDEPTANLDLIVQRELHSLLQDLNKHLTVVMVSHDPAFVSEFVKSVICVSGTVAVHPTGEKCGDILGEMFGASEMRIVRHDQRYGEEQ